ncbi:MAG: tRNA (adenosine(37)-N6)-dimethylallyltransferase MiaA [Bacteroidales bacterium]|nr:tRNA (adenosine(37)-N6)-dimethylallyltransferase MiaA [Bacteroidales bacterium]
MNKPELIIIAGPTSVGKTEVSLEIAKHFNTEIINCDSRQMFKEMKIGSGYPSEEELKSVKHHFIGNLSIHDYYNAGRYEEDVIKLLEKLFQKYDKLVVSAGSGLYLDAIIRGIDYMPEYNSEIREILNEKLNKNGLESLLEDLKNCDPKYYEELDKKNVQRVLRGLEVFMLTGKPYSDFRIKQHKERFFDMTKICLTRDREELYRRIEQRVDIMHEAGLENEAKYIYENKNLPAAKTIGYREWFPYFDGDIDLQEVLRLIKRNTRHLARRQITWFKAKPDFIEIPADNISEILRYIKTNLK